MARADRKPACRRAIQEKLVKLTEGRDVAAAKSPKKRRPEIPVEMRAKTSTVTNRPGKLGIVRQV
jgi:hypothetical protein